MASVCVDSLMLREERKAQSAHPMQKVSRNIVRIQEDECILCCWGTSDQTTSVSGVVLDLRDVLRQQLGTWPGAGFLNIHTIDIWGRKILWCVCVCVCVCGRGRSLVHCKIFSSISGLYTLDASSILPTPHLSRGKTKNVSISCQMSLKITYHFRLKTAALK